MNILRLPAPLRRALLAPSSPLRRYLSTSTPLSRNPPKSSHTLPHAGLSSYAISVPPTPINLKFSSSFFQSSPPTLLYTTSTFRLIPPSPFPEVAFLGRSNVGKSSLLNALFGRPNVRDAHVSKRPGRTRSMNGFGISDGLDWGKAPSEGEKEARWKRFPRGGILVVDMPGYGAGSREEWGSEVLKFLEQRKQLRRCFVLVDAEHGLKTSDIQLLTHLRRNAVNFSIILSKVDKILYAGSRAPGAERLVNKTAQIREMCDAMRRRLDSEAGDGRKMGVDILCCSAEKSLERSGGVRRIGIEEVRWAALSACGVECDETGRRRGVGQVTLQSKEVE